MIHRFLVVLLSVSVVLLAAGCVDKHIEDSWFQVQAKRTEAAASSADRAAEAAAIAAQKAEAAAERAERAAVVKR